MFSYTLDESSFVILKLTHRVCTFTDVNLFFRYSSVMTNLHHTYTEEEREDAMFSLDLELVIWGYLILEYSLSFGLFL